MPETLRTPAHMALMDSLITQRKAKGMTQQQLANELHRPQSFVAKIETGERRLDVIEFAEVILVLGVQPESLLNPIFAALAEN